MPLSQVGDGTRTNLWSELALLAEHRKQKNIFVLLIRLSQRLKHGSQSYRKVPSSTEYSDVWF